jgi:hypothetical protein
VDVVQITCKHNNQFTISVGEATGLYSILQALLTADSLTSSIASLLCNGRKGTSVGPTITLPSSLMTMATLRR